MNTQTGLVRNPGARVRPGFTLIELVIVVLIGGVLAAVAVPPVTSYMEGRKAIQARDGFIRFAARARIAAVEEGDFVLMTVSAIGDSVVITSQRDAAVIDVLRLYSAAGKAGKVDIVGDGEITICYTPRGYAHQACEHGANLPDSVAFATPTDTAWATITLGRVESK